MQSRLFLYFWTILTAIQVTTAIDCPPLAILNDLQPQFGQCVATNVCISEDGTAAAYDGSPNSKASCTATIVALRCSDELINITPEGQLVGCYYSVLEFGNNGTIKRTCCMDMHEQVHHYVEPQQQPLSDENTHSKIEVANEISVGESPPVEERNEWKYEEGGDLEVPAENLKLQDEGAGLVDGQEYEPEDIETWESEEGDEWELDDDEDSEFGGDVESKLEEFDDWEPEYSQESVLEEASFAS
ncbi:hypothetical protein B7494_g1660 [Chlorociboria aeruginascens]|nr:hypothetical protein B7494_g1660 [Chlorociboria aeruginascens]